MSIYIDKIDPGFLNRINSLPANQIIKAILILSDETEYKHPETRPTEQERKTIINLVLKSGEKAMQEINSILQAYGGTKQASSPNALGCLSIATTGAGIKALACLDRVKAVMEDQPVYLIY